MLIIVSYDDKVTRRGGGLTLSREIERVTGELIVETKSNTAEANKRKVPYKPRASS